jgi:hypothetical protein
MPQGAGSFRGVRVAFEACGAAPAKAGVGGLRGTLRTALSRRPRWQVGGFFPAPSAAFDRHRSGALEDITGVSLPSGEPLVFSTP